MTDEKPREDEFWIAVEAALKRLDRDASRAATLRADLEHAPAERRTYFFHMDPFDVALLLAGIKREDAEPHWQREVARRQPKKA
jgi:hypothetical protein